jgi:hypothetical protein
MSNARALRSAALALCLAACALDSIAIDTYGGGQREPVCVAGATESCFDGPTASDGVGACARGTRACDPSGARWGPCVGQILPATEHCGNDVDENCDGAKSCGETELTLRYGVERSEAINDVAVDAQGELLFTGNYRDPIDLGTGMLPSQSQARDVVVAKVSPQGQTRWARTINGKENIEPGVIAAGPKGEIAVTAAFVASVTALGKPLTSTGSGDAVIGLLEPDGATRWVMRGGGSEDDRASGIGFFDDGSLAVSGWFRRKLDLGGAMLESSDVDDGFVIRLGADGKAVWARAIAGNNSQRASAMAVSKNKIAVTGSFRGELVTPAAKLAAPIDRDSSFVTVLSSDGDFVWARGFGAASCNAVAFSGASVAVTGSFSGALDFDGIHLEAQAGSAIFVAMFDESGRSVWAKRYGDSSDQDATGLATDSRGRLVLTGFYQESITFGGNLLPPGAVLEPNLFVVKLEPDGNVVWSRGVAVSGDQWAFGYARGWRRVAIGPGDSIALAGYVVGPLDLGSGKTVDKGGADMLLARLAP